MLIINAKIITMESADFENGYIRCENGIITDVDDMQFAPSGDSDVIDVRSATVYPGFIDAHSHIGMWEDSLAAEGDDGNEETDPVTPHMSALDAVNPTDRCFEEALAAGITTVLTGPGSANPISGSWIAMKTHGRRIDDMVINPNVGMKFSLGENPKSVYNAKGQSPATRMATAALIREQLNKTKRYMSDLTHSEQDDDFDPPEYDSKCEALIPVLKREAKAFFHAHRSDDIFTALRIAREFGLDCVLIHVTDGHKIADILSGENANVIVGPVICDRSKPELKGHTIENAGALANAGVKTAICTDHPVIPIQYLGISAGLCVKGGMNDRDALRAVTINAAEICGIDNAVGSIKVGKHADFAVFDCDPFSVYAAPKTVIINGKVVRGEIN